MLGNKLDTVSAFKVVKRGEEKVSVPNPEYEKIVQNYSIAITMLSLVERMHQEQE